MGAVSCRGLLLGPAPAPGLLSALTLSLQVLEAHKQGLRPAVGYELNPWLLWLAQYRAWKAGCHGQVSFLKQDLWKVTACRG